MPPDRHYRMLHVAGEEQPPIVVLSVVVIDAEGLEAKDANGKLGNVIKSCFIHFGVFAPQL